MIGRRWASIRTATGIGEPVSEYRIPNTGSSWPIAVPATSDEFDHSALGLQWQWQGNSRPEWLSLTASPGQLRLMAHPLPQGASTLYDAPNVLCEKLPAPELTVTTKLTLHAGSGVRTRRAYGVWASLQIRFIRVVRGGPADRGCKR